jgi:hypothetical protein
MSRFHHDCIKACLFKLSVSLLFVLVNLLAFAFRFQEVQKYSVNLAD